LHITIILNCLNLPTIIYPIEYRYILINIYFSIVGLQTFGMLKKMVYIGVNFFGYVTLLTAKGYPQYTPQSNNNILHKFSPCIIINPHNNVSMNIERRGLPSSYYSNVIQNFLEPVLTLYSLWLPLPLKFRITELKHERYYVVISNNFNK